MYVLNEKPSNNFVEKMRIKIFIYFLQKIIANKIRKNVISI